MTSSNRAISSKLHYLACPPHWQRFPSSQRPVTIMLSSPAGGVSGVLARNLQWPQPVVIDNKAGGSQNITTGTVAKSSSPDVCTPLLSDDDTFTLNPNPFNKLPYALKNFASVAELAELQMVMFTSHTLPANTVAELVDPAKACPASLHGSFGVGNLVH